MISLKYTSVTASPQNHRLLTDLPHEVLVLILRCLFHGSGDHLSSIVPVSRSCWKFREASHPILFEILTIVLNEDIIQWQSWAYLEHLFSRPHLLKHVRCLRLQRAIQTSRIVSNNIQQNSAQVGENLSKAKLFQCLARMTGLRHIVTYDLSTVGLDLLWKQCLQELSELTVSFHLKNVDVNLKMEQLEKYLRLIEARPAWIIDVATTTLPAEVGIPIHHRLGSMSKWRAFCCWDDLSATASSSKDLGRPSRLEEVHVGSGPRMPSYPIELALRSDAIPWKSLRRLHVKQAHAFDHILETADQILPSLESLHLSGRQNAFHRDRRQYTGTNGLDEAFSYTRLPNLRHLSLEGVCQHIPTWKLVTSNLRSLKLLRGVHHTPGQRAYPTRFDEVWPVTDFAWIANHLHHLQHLEIQIGPLENLWHATAVPGVDVNPEVYQALAAIGRIKRLRTLRLFPPYIDKTSSWRDVAGWQDAPTSTATSGTARQPVSDEQAMKIFHYLRSQQQQQQHHQTHNHNHNDNDNDNNTPRQSTLHTLSIAPTFSSAGRFRPMTWTVRDGGTSLGPGNHPEHKTILVFRQAGLDYESRQVWVGARRLRSWIKKFSFDRPFLPRLYDGDGWVFPVDDFLTP